MSRTPRAHRAILLPVLAPLAAAFLVQPATQPPTFSEEVLMREVAVVVEPPEGRGQSPPPAHDDFTVLEDGLTRRVTLVERLGDPALPAAASWSIVVYIDRILAGPRLLSLAASRLGEHAARLTAMGEVEIAVADPEPRVVLAPTREPTPVAQRLADIATAAGGVPGAGAEAANGGGRRRPLPDSAALRPQADRLLTLLAERRTAGPRLLLLISAGFDVSADEMARLGGVDAPLGGEPQSFSRALGEISRALAAYGWVTVPLPLTDERLDPREPTRDELDRLQEMATGESRNTIDVTAIGRPEQRREGADDRIFESQIQPALLPLHHLAGATGGTVIRFPEQIGPMLERLPHRWRLWYQTPDRLDGRLRPIQVRLGTRQRPLRSVRWVRSSTPEIVAAARLRTLLRGGQARGDLTLSASAVAGVEGSERRTLDLELELGALRLGDTAPGPLRLSFGFAGADTVLDEVRHSSLTDIRVADGRWRHRLSVTIPAGADRLGVAVEYLPQESWGALAVELGPGAARAERENP